jgi:hypothetical protein
MNLRTAVAMSALVLAVTASGCNSNKLRFDSVNPAAGRMTGGEEVLIRGSGFDKLGNLEVRIGGRPATNVGVQGDDTIRLTTPEGRENDANHPLDIHLLTADGRSIVLRSAFQYRPGAAQQGGSQPTEDLRRQQAQ